MTLEDFYKEHYTRLFKFACLLVEDEDRAHDLVQQTFIQAIRYPYDPTRGKGVYGYLVMLMKTEFLDLCEKEESLRQAVGDAIEYDLLDLHDDYNPWPSVNRSIDMKRLIDRMHPEIRDAAMDMIEGYNAEEIAKRHGLDPRTARRRVAKARFILLGGGETDGDSI